jgi:hypothetical protein
LKQFEHAVAPAADTLPAAQLPHVSIDVAVTAVENVPAKQSVQPALPVCDLCFPAAQEVHVPPSGPV